MDTSKIEKKNDGEQVSLYYDGKFIGKSYKMSKDTTCTRIFLGNLLGMDKSKQDAVLKLGVDLEDISYDYIGVWRNFYNDEEYAIRYWYSMPKMYNLIEED